MFIIEMLIYLSFLVYLGSLIGKFNSAISIIEVQPINFKTTGDDYPEAYKYQTQPEDDNLFDVEIEIDLGLCTPDLVVTGYGPNIFRNLHFECGENGKNVLKLNQT